MLDLAGNGIETMSLEEDEYFDHDGDGLAELTGWIRASDGFLARDLDGDGTIGSGKELFGSQTRLKNGHNAENGFAALAELDDNGDGVIDAKDRAYTELRVWRGRINRSRAANPGELLGLARAGILSIGLAYADAADVDENGHLYRQIAPVKLASGATSSAVGVWFRVDTALRQNTGTIELGPDVLFLPSARSFGKVHDLHQAMVLDPGLRVYLDRYLRAAPAERDARLDELIYRWSGVESIDPHSRDFNGKLHFIDARRLGVLERLAGRAYLGRTGPNPYRGAAQILEAEYRKFKNYTAAQLLAKTEYASEIDVRSYFGSDAQIIVVNWTPLGNTLEALRAAGRTDRIAEILTVLADLGAYDPTYRAERDAALAALPASHPGLAPFLSAATSGAP